MDFIFVNTFFHFLRRLSLHPQKKVTTQIQIIFIDCDVAVELDE